jgi:uncharacterized phage protein gp47/JayE
MTLDATGLTIKTAAEIQAEIEAALLSSIGPQLQLGADTAIGQVIATVSTQLGLAYELAQDVWDATAPDTAAGASLDNLAALVGVTRDPATVSTGTLTFNGTPSTVIPAGSVYRVPNGPSFETTSPAVIPIGPIVVPIASLETGAITAGAGTITEFVTVIAGVSSVSNSEAVTPGREVETDAELRLKREAGFAQAGAGTDGAIAAEVAEIDTVAQVIVISNRTSATDALLIPPKSFRCVVWPAQAADEPVFQAIYDTMPAGILADGSITGTVTDSQGISQPVAYELADDQEIHIETILTVDSLTYGGDTEVEDALVALGVGLQLGEDILIHELSAAVVNAVTGILTIETRAKIGGAPGPGDIVNIDIELDEIATIDVGDITVTT